MDAVYAARGARQLLEVTVLTIGVAAFVLGYRFASFVLILYAA